jgi:hypothetical protein
LLTTPSTCMPSAAGACRQQGLSSCFCYAVVSPFGPTAVAAAQQPSRLLQPAVAAAGLQATLLAARNPQPTLSPDTQGCWQPPQQESSPMLLAVMSHIHCLHQNQHNCTATACTPLPLAHCCSCTGAVLLLLHQGPPAAASRETRQLPPGMTAPTLLLCCPHRPPGGAADPAAVLLACCSALQP